MKTINFHYLSVILTISYLIHFSNVKSMKNKSKNSKAFFLDNKFGIANLENKILSDNIEDNTAKENSKKTALTKSINQAKVMKLNFDPLLEDEFEKNKMITATFLGTIIPKLEPEPINCKNLNLTNFNDTKILKICNLTSLIQLHLNQDSSNPARPNRGIECTLDTCNPSMGICNLQNECICEKGFVDDPDVSVNKYCSYKQKRQLLFFLIEFFAPFGLGHILNGRFLYGIIKCSIVVGIVSLDVLSRCIIMCGSERGAKCPNYFSFVYYFLLIVWHAFDITMIGFNKFNDGNNINYIPVEV